MRRGSRLGSDTLGEPMRGGLLVALFLLVATPSAAAKITKETLDVDGTKRTFYLLVSDKLQDKAPLIVTLHGSGRDGKILLDHWKGLAEKEGIILAGPDATERQGWEGARDGPAFLYALVEHLKSKHAVDPRRVYLFGHSAGAIHGLGVGVLESEYFAAVAAHAGVLPQAYAPYAKQAPRKIPLAIWVGTNDRFFPVNDVRQTRDALDSMGFPVGLTEIKGHTHDYYSRASGINKEVWAFLQKHRLEADPKYQEYAINK